MTMTVAEFRAALEADPEGRAWLQARFDVAFASVKRGMETLTPAVRAHADDTASALKALLP